MKLKMNLQKCLVMVILLGVTVTSCDDNDVDIFGSADLKVINVAPNSPSQKFVLANIPEIGNLDYLDGSVAYLNVASGNNLVAQFRDEDGNDLYATEQFDIDDNRDYTIYLTGESRDDAEVRLFQDDLTAPASGKAKVKFIHLSSSAPAAIDFSVVGGNSLSAGVGRFNASAYSEIDAGSISVNVSAAGQSESIATLQATAFNAGKIYTVYLAGSVASGFVVRQVLHN